MDINKEKLQYILKYYDDYIDKFIDEVLHDSNEDPHYSAVSTTNLIKCYIQIKIELGEQLPYNNVQEYMLFNAFSKEEYDAFEKSRKNESEYYNGVQY